MWRPLVLTLIQMHKGFWGFIYPGGLGGGTNVTLGLHWPTTLPLLGRGRQSTQRMLSETGHCLCDVEAEAYHFQWASLAAHQDGDRIELSHVWCYKRISWHQTAPWLPVNSLRTRTGSGPVASENVWAALTSPSRSPAAIRKRLFYSFLKIF